MAIITCKTAVTDGIQSSQFGLVQPGSKRVKGPVVSCPGKGRSGKREKVGRWA